MTEPESKTTKKMCDSCRSVPITIDNMNAFQDMIVCSTCIKELREYEQPPATPAGEVIVPEQTHNGSVWTSANGWG